MRKVLFILLLMHVFILPVSAMELEAPVVPEAGRDWMPDNTESFPSGIMELLEKGVRAIRPDLAEAASVCVSLMAAVMLTAILRTFSGPGKALADLAGTAAIAAILFLNTNAMIRLGDKTIQEMSNYGKLLFPVMAGTLAAQGGITSSSAIYAGTTIFDTLICSVISSGLVPMVYLFLALALANSILGEDILKRLRDIIKSFLSWCLKTILTVFTTYISITGIVSGTTDAAALKATKITLSSVVPVVGGILSDASEAVLVSAGIMKNTAGVYGILAILALFLNPFLIIGTHYLCLKATAAICGIIGSGSIIGLIEDFSSAMGLLLAMTGSVCLLLLISTICFMKGVG